MSTFLKFTDPEGRPVYVRAALVESVSEHRERGGGAFGVHPNSAPADNTHTRVHMAGGGGFHKVTESAEDVVDVVNRSGR